MVELISSGYDIFDLTHGLLSPEEEQELLSRHEENSQGVESTLLFYNRRTINSFIMKWYKMPIVKGMLEYDDLYMSGIVGYLSAIKCYDHKSGGRLSTFAFWKMRYEVSQEAGKC